MTETPAVREATTARDPGFAYHPAAPSPLPASSYRLSEPSMPRHLARVALGAAAATAAVIGGAVGAGLVPLAQPSAEGASLALGAVPDLPPTSADDGGSTAAVDAPREPVSDLGGLTGTDPSTDPARRPLSGPTRVAAAPPVPAPQSPSAPVDRPLPALPVPAGPSPTSPDSSDPSPTEPRPTRPDPSESSPTRPSPTRPSPTKPEPTRPEPTRPEPTRPGPTEPSDGGGRGDGGRGGDGRDGRGGRDGDDGRRSGGASATPAPGAPGGTGLTGPRRVNASG